MQNKQQGIISPIVIAIIVIAVLGVGGFVAYTQYSEKITQEQELETETNTENTTNEQQETNTNETTIQQQTEIAGWKTYTNTEYGFEVKFPISEMISPNDIPDNVIDGNFYYDTSYKEITIGSLNAGCVFRIFPNIDDKFLSKIKNTDIKQLSILENNDKKYFIGYSVPSSAISISECTSAFDKIIPTFKFTNINNWSNYNQEQLMNMVKNEPWYTDFTYYKGLSNNFLVLDQGTAPYPRGIIVYDLSAKKTVLQDQYSIPLDINTNEITYWMPTTIKVTNENCPESVEWAKNGLGAGIESYVSFNLTTLVKKDLGKTRCKPMQ